MRNLFFALLVLIISGCAKTGVSGLASTLTPSVDLKSVNLTDANLNAQKFNLNFDVKNPNAFPLPLNAIEYDLSLNGIGMISGNDSLNTTIPANASSNLTIPVSTNVINSISGLTKLLQKSGVPTNLDYNLNAKVSVGGGYFSLPVPISQNGSIPFQSLIR